jgi:uncharacterized damage-inducible protein DinB
VFYPEANDGTGVRLYPADFYPPSLTLQPLPYPAYVLPGAFRRIFIMTKDYFRELFQYNYWAHRQVWACVETLTEEQFKRELDYSIGAIYIQCAHTMGVESWWFHFLKTGELRFVEMGEIPDRPAIRARWDVVEREVMGYVESLTPAELERDVRPEFWDEGTPAIKVWEAMVKVANHSTDHRAQTLAGLHRLGAPTVSALTICLFKPCWKSYPPDMSR